MAARILLSVESPRGLFCYRSVCGANAQPASVRCRMKGVWEQPNKHFEFGFEKSNSKIASWYQLALLAAEDLKQLLFIALCLLHKQLII